MIDPVARRARGRGKRAALSRVQARAFFPLPDATKVQELPRADHRRFDIRAQDISFAHRQPLAA